MYILEGIVLLRHAPDTLQVRVADIIDDIITEVNHISHMRLRNSVAQKTYKRDTVKTLKNTAILLHRFKFC